MLYDTDSTEFEGGLTEDQLAQFDAENEEEDGDRTLEENAEQKRSRMSVQSDGVHIDGLKEFGSSQKLFYDLTKRNLIDTQFSVVSVILTYDSKNSVAIVREHDERWELQAFNLETLQPIFRQIFEGDYIKMN